MLNPTVLRVERLLFQSDLACIGAFRCPPDDVLFPDSGAPGCHVICCYRAAVWIGIDDGPFFVADPNVATFHHAGEPFRKRRLSTAGDVCDWFALDTGLIREMVGAYAPRALDDGGLFPGRAALMANPLFVRQRQLVESVAASAWIDPLAVEEGVLDVFAGLVRAPVPAGATSHPPGHPRAHVEIVEHVRAVLAAEFRVRLSLRALAARAGCSPFHLSRIFRLVVGTTIRDYLRQLRLREAVTQLSAGAADLTSLAFALGFSSHAHFTGAFTAAFGCTPSAYRRRQNP